MYTNEQIDKWTAEAGIDTRGDGIRDDGTSSIYYEAWPEQLTRFATLVAQHERAKCIYAVDGERLVDTSLPEDAAYERALDHAIAAIRNSDGG